MRFIGALLLVILGIGFFPFNARVLTTWPGLFLAALSLALIFFAYRLATASKKISVNEASLPNDELNKP